MRQEQQVQHTGVRFQTLDDASFDTVVGRRRGRAVVDFWAPWCAPCRFLGEALEQIAPELPAELAIYKVNVDENPVTAGRFGIRSIPALVFFEDGRPLGMLLGARPAPVLREILARFAAGERIAPPNGAAAR